MRTVAKVSLVASGYLLAGLGACLAVGVHMAVTASDRGGADGMYAFGDLLLFLGVFGLVALVPTGLGIYFVVAGRSGRANKRLPNA